MRTTSSRKVRKSLKKSIYSEKHKKLCRLLTEARKKAGLTQQDLADKIGKPQSFIAKYEGGERRLDVIELIEIASIISLDPKLILKTII